MNDNQPAELLTTDRKNCDDITTTVEHLLAEEDRHLTEYVAAAERAE